MEQSLLGRLLGYGTVTIRGTGAGIVPSPGLSSPKAFQKAIQAGQAKMRSTLGPLPPIQIHTGTGTQS